MRAQIDEELDNRKHVYHGIDSVLVSCEFLIAETHIDVCCVSVQSSRTNLANCARTLHNVPQCGIFSSIGYAFSGFRKVEDRLM